MCIDRDLFRDPSILEGYGGDRFRQVLGHLSGQPAPRVHGQGEPDADPTPRYKFALARNHIHKTLLNYFVELFEECSHSLAVVWIFRGLPREEVLRGDPLR